MDDVAAGNFRTGEGTGFGSRIARLLVVLVFGACITAHAQQNGALLETTPLGVLEPGGINGIIDGGLPRAQHAVDAYVIRFASEYPDGAPARVTAQVFVPHTTGDSYLYVFGPGSTGLIDRCAPSREHQIGVNWGNYRGHALAHAAQGSIGVVVDYMGFGDPDRLQPYYVKDATGRVLLDAARAVEALLAEVQSPLASQGVFLAGYSQGGHAAFAAADLRDAYAPEVEILGIVGYGPATDLEALFREFTVAIPMVVYTYANLYGSDRFDPNVILADRWLRNLRGDLLERCIGAIQDFYPWSGSALYRPEFADALYGGTLEASFPEIHGILRENSAGLSGHGVPAAILQGTDDIVVYIDSQHAFVRQLCEMGSEVYYPNYEGARHDTRNIGFADARAWMNAVFLGEEFRNDCAVVPAN